MSDFHSRFLLEITEGDFDFQLIQGIYSPLKLRDELIKLIFSIIG